MANAYSVLGLLIVVCFSLATYLEPWFQSWAGSRSQSASLLAVLLGDSRRLFANHFFAQADSYFHRGYYPTVFDNRESFETSHVAEDAGTHESQHQEGEVAFLGEPLDRINRFGRNFFPSAHTHLDDTGPPAEETSLRCHRQTAGTFKPFRS